VECLLYEINPSRTDGQRSSPAVISESPSLPGNKFRYSI
jgi:hypothetical protein